MRDRGREEEDFWLRAFSELTALKEEFEAVDNPVEDGVCWKKFLWPTHNVSWNLSAAAEGCRKAFRSVLLKNVVREVSGSGDRMPDARFGELADGLDAVAAVVTKLADEERRNGTAFFSDFFRPQWLGKSVSDLRFAASLENGRSETPENGG